MSIGTRKKGILSFEPIRKTRIDADPLNGFRMWFSGFSPKDEREYAPHVFDPSFHDHARINSEAEDAEFTDIFEAEQKISGNPGSLIP